MADDYHVTRVQALPKLDRWQAVCTVCGKVGMQCDLEADAWAIADRHAEVQGFERP